MEETKDVLIKVRFATRKNLKIVSANKGKTIIELLEEFANQELAKIK